jgi:hypothetical protein
MKTFVMPDNPNKKARDRKFISQQPHEQAGKLLKRSKEWIKRIRQKGILKIVRLLFYKQV